MTTFGQVYPGCNRIFTNCNLQILTNTEDVRGVNTMIFNLFLLSFSAICIFCDLMQPYFYFVLTTERCIRFLPEMYCTHSFKYNRFY